jgi:hypothetical protein
LNQEIAWLAHRQHGVVTRGQLRERGLGDTAISARAASGQLHPLYHGTFAVGHRLIGRVGRMRAATLACGDGTIVSHGSAAELLGLWDKRPTVIDVIPPDWSGRKIDGIRWHRVRYPTADELEVRDGIPCTTPSRTIVDMAGRLSERPLGRMVQQAAVLRALDVSQIDRVLARGRRRGAPRLRAILAPWRQRDRRQPRLRSLLEARVLPGLIEAGLPRPECNVKMRIDGHPRPLEVDLLWRERRLVIETDGEETHGTRAAFHEDRRRDQALVAAGYRTARVTWRQIEDEPKAVIARIRRMLAQG